MPPIVRRRRTRSRRTTRRLHRTRRQRGGADKRMELDTWKKIADEKWGPIKDKSTLQFMTGLVDERLTLTPDKAPDITTFTGGKSEASFAGSSQTGQTLLSAISNVNILLGGAIAENFANMASFKDTLVRLQQLASDPYSPANGLYRYLSQLEGYIRTLDPSQSVDLMSLVEPTPDQEDPMLYIWFAAANFDHSKSEDYSVPMLITEPTEEKKSNTSTPQAPAQKE
jgi:hypothetical protein